MPLRRSLEMRALVAAVLLTAALVAPAAASVTAPARDTWWQPVAETTTVAAAEAVSVEQLSGHARALAIDIGSRPGHTEAFRRAADYARAHLSALGYQVSLQEFRYPHWEDLGSSLALDAEGRTISALAMRGSPDSDVDGELVDVGLARQQDLGPIGRLDGKIALAKRGEITFRAKAENAKALGAAGIVIFNNERGQLHGHLGENGPLPSIGITADSGAALVEQLRRGPAGARLVARSVAEERPSVNVVAHGGDPAAAGRVVVGGHLDSVAAGPGANDNASGSSAVLELARVFAERPERERLSFILFGAEEEGLWGSRRYVDRVGPESARRLRAMVNLDMVGVVRPLRDRRRQRARPRPGPPRDRGVDRGRPHGPLL